MAAKKEQTIEKVDILNRAEFIDRVINLVKLVSSHKGNTTFAINGEWGCGKTFVMNEVQKRLDDDESKQYLVIPYNCWQYDYYDEPLVAIVSAFISFLKKSNKVSPKRKEKVVKVLKQVGKTALSWGGQILENKTGFNFMKAADDVVEIVDSVEAAGDIDDAFDNLIDLKEALEDLRKVLSDLAKTKTIVFCVDELDRCLPEYAVKVLERMHHVSENVPSMITILAVDKTRLENTISSIFGNEKTAQEGIERTVVSRYLKKFIHFEISLDKGTQNSQNFYTKFSDYLNKFDASLYTKLNATDRFVKELFKEMVVRSQEQVVELASTAHDLCFGDEKQDLTIMYAELFYTTMLCHYKAISVLESKKRADYNKSPFAFFKDIPAHFKDKDSGFYLGGAPTSYAGFDRISIHVDPSNIFMLVFYYWYYIPQSKVDYEIGANECFPLFDSRENSVEFQRVKDNIQKLNNYISILKYLG